MHSHVLIPEAAVLVQPYIDLAASPLANFATPNTQALNRRQDTDRRANMTEVEVRLADMDAAGIDMQIIMPPPGQCTYSVPLEIGIKAAEIINDGIAAFVAQQPARFQGLGTVPMQDPATAVRALEACVTERGLKGVQILTNIAGKELSDPAYTPFWEAAEALRAVVLIHPNGFTEAERLRRFYFNNVLGNPLETTVALHYLIFDGVLERYPALKLVAVHGGGYLAAYSGRIDHAWGARSDVRTTLPQPPTTYLRRVFFDTVVFTPHQLTNLIGVFGVNQILMGTDYPYDMAEADPIGHLASADLDAAAFSAIAGGNAKALFGV
jgi:aminocarboxymuconate-semialdehyde decarboxylase